MATAPLAVVQLGFAWCVAPLARAGARLFNDVAHGLPRAIDDSVVSSAEPSPVTDWGVPETESEGKSREGSVGREDGSAASAPASARQRSVNARPPVMAAGVMKLADRGPVSRRERSSVFVGPESIQRAIPAANRPTSIWTERTPQHPAGLLIQSPGVLRGVIEAGDILVEAEGQTLGSFEQLITAVKQAYERRDKRLYGRIFRKGDFVPVTVEPGWQ